MAAFVLTYLWGRNHGKDALQAKWDASIVQATVEAKETEAKQRDQIKELNVNHVKSTQELASRLAAALSQPPRIVRVPDGSCSRLPESTGDARESAPDNGPRPTDESAEDYRVLRDSVLRLGAEAEALRRAALQCREAWPK